MMSSEKYREGEPEQFTIPTHYQSTDSLGTEENAWILPALVAGVQAGNKGKGTLSMVKQTHS